MRKPKLHKRFVQIIDYVAAISDIKYRYRFDGDEEKLKDGKDVVAAHCWSTALLAYELSREANRQDLYTPKLDEHRLHDGSEIHDVSEGLEGDEMFHHTLQLTFDEKRIREMEKFERELAAMRHYTRLLPKDLAKEKMSLWLEMENRTTRDAKFFRVMDNLDSALGVMRIGLGPKADGLVEPDSVIPHLLRHYEWGWHQHTDALIWHMAYDRLKPFFEKTGFPWKPEYNLPGYRTR